MQNFPQPAVVASGRSMRRRLAAIALALIVVVSGCALSPPVEKISPDLELFQQGVDALAATEFPDAFSRLTSEYPESPWTARAQTILGMQADLKAGRSELDLVRKGFEACRKGLEECGSERDRLADDGRSLDELQKNLDACRVEKNRLGSDVRSLEKYILKLKSLLSESGIAEPTAPPR